MIYRGKIAGTINDDFEIEVMDGTTEEEAREVALGSWRYVEYEDLVVADIEPVVE